MKLSHMAGLGAAAAALFVGERLVPLRHRKAIAHGVRLAANAILAGTASAASASLLRPSFNRASRLSEEQRRGLTALIPGPQIVRDAAAFLLMDLGYYWWHRANHRSRFLWRFHNVHHVDPELDLSTGARFHVGEIALSAIAAAGWVLVIGIRPKTVMAFQSVFAAAVAFHHANLRLPYRFERLLSRVVVTPRMHGVHHSKVHRETDSNFASVFSFWDRIFGTMRLNVPQDVIDIGVPAYGPDEALSVGRSLSMPFRRQRDYWKADEGARDERALGPWRDEPPTELAP